MKSPIKVAVTGAAGQIGYALLPRIASGGLFGPDQPVELRLIEIAPALKPLEGVVMELHDCAFPLLDSCLDDLRSRGRFSATSIGRCSSEASLGKPAWSARSCLGSTARYLWSKDRRLPSMRLPTFGCWSLVILVTQIALIAMNNASEVPSDRWFAMTRLDENRAKTQLALKSGSHWRDVTNMAIWGNHSSTLYPDFFNARIGGKSANDVISDREWLETTFIKTVQQRGAAIIQARGLSSAKSAAHGALESVKSITEATPGEDWHSVALCSDGSYGVEKGLICSFPTRSDGSEISIVQNVALNDFAKAKIEASVNELKEERAMVAELLPR